MAASDKPEMFAVVPKTDCPHVESLKLVESPDIDGTKPCETCSDVSENWVCLVCSAVFCSRYVKEHMVEHNKQSKHPISFSLRDASVWCYDCDSYIESQKLKQVTCEGGVIKYSSSSTEPMQQEQPEESMDTSEVQPVIEPPADKGGGREGGGGREFSMESSLPKGELISRMWGVLYGNCIGDAIGLLTEFMTKDEAHEVYGTKKKKTFLGLKRNTKDIKLEDINLEYSMKHDDFHRSRWRTGDWTDDSDQMILILRTLLNNNGEASITDFAVRFRKWTEEGYKELGDMGAYGVGRLTFNVLMKRDFLADPHKAICTDFARQLKEWSKQGYPELGDCVGYGQGRLTRSTLSHIRFLTEPIKCARQVWEDSGKWAAPNGGVMRTSVLGIQDFSDIQRVIHNTKQICQVTHADQRCVASCVAVTTAISMMLQGQHCSGPPGYKFDVNEIAEKAYSYACECLETDEQKTEMRDHMFAKSLEDLQLAEGKKIGYTFKCLGSGFWALRQNDFRLALTSVTMQAGDADTNGAVAGALLGCKLSVKGMPESWIDGLLHKEWLDKQIIEYFKMLGVTHCEESE